MKKLLLALLVVLPFVLKAQMLEERRVYYLDCSYSMVTNGIWDKVRENLCNAIDKVSDINTELIVVPFALDHNGGCCCFSDKATEKGKENLKTKISKIVPNRSSMTYHQKPLEDFYKNRVDPSKVTYMFLMTDGQDEYPNKELFFNELKKWQSKFGEKSVYGFYVMLDQSAQNEKIEKICNTQTHLWKVETADVNINPIRLETSAIFNARNEEYLKIPVRNGSVKGMSFSASFPKNSTYKVKSVQLKNEELIVYVIFSGNVYSLPPLSQEKLSIGMKGGGSFDILLTDKINVKCISKPERSLIITVR